MIVVPNDRHGQLDTAALAGLVDERVKLIGVSHVPTSGGLVNPAAKIGRIARDAGVLFLLDATQSVGQFPVNVDAIGCDLLTATGRKFLRGPGAPGSCGFAPRPSSGSTRSSPRSAPRPGTAAAGSPGPGGPALRVLGEQLRQRPGPGRCGAAGSPAGYRRDRGPHRHARCAASRPARALPAVSVHDLGEVRCAIVTARVEGVPAADVAAALGRAGVNVSTTVAEHSPLDTEDRAVHPLVRFSPHYYNTEEELDRAVSLVAAIAHRGHATR